MKFEITYNKKAGGIYRQKLKGQEVNVKKLCRRENNANHEEDCSAIRLSKI